MYIYIYIPTIGNPQYFHGHVLIFFRPLAFDSFDPRGRALMGPGGFPWSWGYPFAGVFQGRSQSKMDQFRATPHGLAPDSVERCRDGGTKTST